MAAKGVVTEDKFGFLDKRKKPATTEPIEETTATPAPVKAPSVPAKAIAKSKDPNKKGYTLILNVETHVDASSLLKKLRSGEDMSDLTERLLAGWVKKEKAKLE
jgi:hypothetical protein